MAESPTLTVREVGEFGLIARLQRRVEEREQQAPLRSRDGWIELAIGDDSAVWQPTAGCRQVITTDALIEDVHFRTRTTGWRDLGWKSLAVNVSDVAAMGAEPRAALVSLGLPGTARVADMLELYDGMLDVCAEYGLRLVGGDVVSSPIVVLGITVIGEAPGEVLRRDAARVGDQLAVTGTLGSSVGGLQLLESGSPGNGAAQRLIEAHRRPRPRVQEGLALVRAGVRCAMDVSDGLFGDATHICERSGLSALIEVDAVPTDAALGELFGEESRWLAISGGEDYELLCAAPREVMERARVELARVGAKLTVIGRLVRRGKDEALVRLVDGDGRTVEPARGSWDHFRG